MLLIAQDVLLPKFGTGLVDFALRVGLREPSGGARHRGPEVSLPAGPLESYDTGVEACQFGNQVFEFQHGLRFSRHPQILNCDFLDVESNDDGVKQ